MLREGDLVYLLDRKGKRHWFTATRGMIKIPGLGTLNGRGIVGLPSGSAITLAGREFWVMSPGTVEMMEAIERGAQVITPKDAETILLHLDVVCGSVVLEGGVGSGALTLALLRRVGEEGRVISLELREDFANLARRNIEKAGLGKNWTIRIGDVRSIEPDEVVDAAVLDIPDPWSAVANVRRFLTPGGRLCAYVPNMNQVQETQRALERNHFVEIHTLENIQRRIEVHEGGVRPAFEPLSHTGYMTFGRSTVRDADWQTG